MRNIFMIHYSEGEADIVRDNNKNRENLGTFFNKANPKIVRKMKLGKINNRAGALDIKGNGVFTSCAC